MNLELVLKEIEEFSSTTHGSSDYDTETCFVVSKNRKDMAPLRYLKKKFPEIEGAEILLRLGMCIEVFDFVEDQNFVNWYEKQFGKKLLKPHAKKVQLLVIYEDQAVLTDLGKIHDGYETLRHHLIMMNGKNMPTQFGEWLAKGVFGLAQKKSTSQRGFDFVLGDKRVEIKVHHGSQSSPKGVKLKKSLIELSDFCIVIYLTDDFKIRELCFLDSEYVSRKFSGKGHTIFLKDSDVGQYIFSRSNKHYDKVLNGHLLLKYSTAQMAVKLSEHFK